MKKLNQVAMSFMLVFSANIVFADVDLESINEVVGTWKLESTKNTASEKEVALPREDTWIFKNGKVTIMHIPREGKYYDQPPVNYEIEEGKLKVAQVGNTRFDLFSLVEKTDTKMILKGKFGGYYYFNKK
ncbi:MAG: hypothetical protein PHN45_08140 [Methylococcales bacterium]|nr:hypothetical protein [Methylococcales bacterium]MDD5754703.1 hypothetical protein [Methylococcales bacterium]